MFINPRKIVEEGYISHPECKTLQDWEDREFISPNAIDFPLDRLFSIDENNEFIISNQYKQMRGGKEILPVKHRRDEHLFWKLKPNSVYDGMSEMCVSLPDGIVALPLLTRSSFNRNGCYLISGLYDSFFQGPIGFVIHNRSGIAHIVVGTRIGQIAFMKSDNYGKYKGGYNTNPGQHWSESSSVKYNPNQGELWLETQEI